MEERCLLCKQSQDNCSCQGGFKIIYVFGTPMSKEELEQHQSKPQIEQKILSANFIANQLKKVNDKVIEDVSSISIINKDIDKLLNQ